MAARLGNGAPDKTVTVDCATDVAAAISAARLERAVTNLIRNAQQHSHGPIAVTARQEDGQIRIEVRDRGPGFPPDLLPGPSTASPSPTAPAPPPASAWPSSPPSPVQPGAITARPTTPTEAPSSGSPSRRYGHNQRLCVAP
ncbi:sensor histidine kinase [Streptomyces sp. NPDC000994]